MSFDRVLDRELVKPVLGRDVHELLPFRLNHTEPDESTIPGRVSRFLGGLFEGEVTRLAMATLVKSAIDDHRASPIEFAREV